MSKEVICIEVAEAEVQKWAELFDAVLDPDTSAKLTRVVQSGRLSLDEGTSTFTLKLRTPIQLENGKAVGELSIREPTAAEVRGVSRDGEEVGQVIRILSVVTGQPLGVIGQLKLKELTICGELFNFFA